MSDVIIRVDGLGKQYRLGARGRYQTLRERINGLAAAPWRWLRNGGKRPSDENGSDNRFWALKDISFNVRRGEAIGIIGRNGAGKSTLLKILSRVTEPTEGEADIHGRVGSLLEVGTGFHPELTGRENVYLNGTILGMRRAEIGRKFDEIVQFAEVEKFLDTPVKYYSSGMYTRLAFAVAAYLDPEILMVDEVLAVGDAQFQKKCLGKMGDVARGGRTVLFVSHQLGQIRAFCSRCVLLEGGRIVETGSAGRVIERYLSSGFRYADLDVNLTNGRRGVPVAGARLTRLIVNGGKPPTHAEPFELHFTYRADAFVDEAVVGFGFATLDGLRLYSVDSDLADARFRFEAGSSGTVSLRLDHLPLQPGLYALDVGIRSGDLAPVDYLPGCIQIEVLPGPSTPSSIIRSDINGCVRARPDGVSWETAHSQAVVSRP